MKKWLWERALPLWAKQTLLQENKTLQKENAALRVRVRVLESYIRGVHKGMGKRQGRKGTDFSASG